MKENINPTHPKNNFKMPIKGLADKLLSIANNSYSSSNFNISLLNSFSFFLCYLFLLHPEKKPESPYINSKEDLH